jgi:predicted PurR-regulated permease PerM
MNQQVFNERLRQVFVLVLIIVIASLLILEMGIFIPGLLGGFTLYILSRSLYYQLIFKNKWNKSRTALLFMLGYIVIIALPVYFSIALISPKINSIAENQDKIVEGIQSIAAKIKERTGISLLSADSVKSISAKVSSFIPKVLNSTANVLTNLIMMFFLFITCW